VTTQLVKEHLGIDEVVLLLADLDQLRLEPFGSDGSAHRVDDSPAGLAFRTEQPVLEALEGSARRLWLPMLDSAERVGVLGVVDDGPVPLEDWLVLTSLLGELITAKEGYGDAIALARRRHPVSLSAEIRWALLPPLTFSSPEVGVSGILQPSHGVAGDAFDYGVSRSEAVVGVFDAMGHGMLASRLATLAVGGFRHARRRGLRPDVTLAAIDADIAEQFGRSVFVTAQIVALDTTTGVAQIHSAGHPPPAVLRQDDPPRLVPLKPGRPLGLGPSEYRVAEVQLEPGDALLLVSDGTYEARSPDGEPYGWDRLLGLARARFDAGDRPAELLRRCIRDVMDFQGTRVRDDATLALVIHRPEAIGQASGPAAGAAQRVSG
jgi:hypothetical protein